MATEKRGVGEAQESTPPRPVVTYLLIATSTLVFIGMVATGARFLRPSTEDVLMWGGNMFLETLGGQWWRLVTFQFVHFGFVHLASNMLFLWIFASIAERHLGKIRLLVIYLVSGLAPGVVAVLMFRDIAFGGASGSIMGVCGSLYVLLFLRGIKLSKTRRRIIYIGTAFFLLGDLMSPRTEAILIHLGGFAMGIACTMVLIHRDPQLAQKRRRRRLLTVCIPTVALVSGIVLIVPDPIRLRDEAGDAYVAGDWEQAVALYDRYLLLLPKDGVGLFMRGESHFMLQDYELAKRDLDWAIYYVPEWTQGWLWRGKCYLQEEEYALALADFDGAIELDPKNAAAFGNRAFCLYLQERNSGQTVPRHIDGGRVSSSSIQRQSLDLVPPANYLLAARDWRGASELVESNRARARWLEKIGFIHLALGDWEEAMDLTDEVNAIFPGLHWNAHIRSIAANRLGHEDLALQAQRVWVENMGAYGEMGLGKYLVEDLHEVLTRLSSRL